MSKGIIIAQESENDAIKAITEYNREKYGYIYRVSEDSTKIYALDEHERVIGFIEIAKDLPPDGAHLYELEILLTPDIGDMNEVVDKLLEAAEVFCKVDCGFEDAIYVITIASDEVEKGNCIRNYGFEKNSATYDTVDYVLYN